MKLLIKRFWRWRTDEGIGSTSDNVRKVRRQDRNAELRRTHSPLRRQSIGHGNAVSLCYVCYVSREQNQSQQPVAADQERSGGGQESRGDGLRRRATGGRERRCAVRPQRLGEAHREKLRSAVEEGRQRRRLQYSTPARYRRR